MTSPAQLPQISYTSPDFNAVFMASLHRYGFAAVTDHPLDKDRVLRIYDEWLAFFAADGPGDFEMDPVNQDGYFSLQHAEHAKGFVERDHKEYFQFYPWGRCPQSLEADLAAHFNAAVELGAELLECIAAHLPKRVTGSLSEPLRDMIRASEQSMLRVLHYPPVPAGQSVLRAAPHEDINLLTLLPAADGPGLELRLRSGEWLSVSHKPGQLIVNIGDMLQEATGGYLPSTTHRVAAATARDSAASRMSLPLFLHPRPEVVLSPRYTARQYLSQRLDELGVT
ncbi:MAG: 2OG-Fe(II) oxygenase family protein [Luminiphilus sp.]|nr:2OG-Fe(II) oxygenase family protein [Luminiphilus sp.]